MWITRALVVLVAASPCALAISVPVTVVSAIGAASRFGVVIKSGAAFERLGAIRRVAVDKTGTLTRNHPTVADVVVAPGHTRDAVLAWASAVERHSTHPLAAAISAEGTGAPAVDVVEKPGHGVTGTIDGADITVGSPRWVAPGMLADDVARLEGDGQTVVLVHVDGQTVGAIGVRDELRPEAAEAVALLRRDGLEVIMLTGDNTRTAMALAGQAGIDDVRAELRPEEKAAAVADLTRGRSTAMIGDGINDAPRWPVPTSVSPWERPARTQPSSRPTSRSPATICGSSRMRCGTPDAAGGSSTRTLPCRCSSSRPCYRSRSRACSGWPPSCSSMRWPRWW
ncbi:HAD-IC family P-type ATPase [Tessaracoccus coleopterorum]